MPNDAVRRIMAEVKELAALASDPNAMFVAAPLDSDLFEWRFSVRGPPDTAFEGGVYHGRILLPPEYPLKAPEIMLLTPNGRFELNTPICLSVTAHHQETWQPSWGIRTILTALIGFMPSAAEGLGALDFPDHERRKLAIRSQYFVCPRTGVRPSQQLPPLPGAAPAIVAAYEAASAGAASLSSAGAGASSSREAPRAADAAAPAADDAQQSQGSATADNENGGASNAVEQQAAADAGQPSGAVEARSPKRGARRRRSGEDEQERGLLWASYAILILIVGILAKRLL